MAINSNVKVLSAADIAAAEALVKAAAEAEATVKAEAMAKAIELADSTAKAAAEALATADALGAFGPAPVKGADAKRMFHALYVEMGAGNLAAALAFKVLKKETDKYKASLIACRESLAFLRVAMKDKRCCVYYKGENRHFGTTVRQVLDTAKNLKTDAKDVLGLPDKARDARLAAEAEAAATVKRQLATAMAEANNA